MAESAESVARLSATWLQQGQALEAKGQFDPALAAYDRTIAALTAAADADTGVELALGIAWMNRGNVLQKIATPISLADSVRAYDEAIALLGRLPLDSNPRFRNHLGAAWLNRGHAQLTASDNGAAASFEAAIAEFGKLPLDGDPFYRLNLAGTWTNLAHTCLSADPERARRAARSALDLVAPVERTHDSFAAMSLRARRALVVALGNLIVAAEQAGRPIAEFASEATDVIDDGLALARDLEERDITAFRPLALRLFTMGAQLYGIHQPQFLGEFVLENLTSAAFARAPDFRDIARSAVSDALARIQRPQLFVAGSPDGEKLLATAQSLRAAEQRLSALTAS